MAKIDKITVGSTTYDVGSSNYAGPIFVPAFTGSAGGSQSVTVSGVTADDNPILDVYIADVSNADAYNEAWSKVYNATCSANTITLYYTDTADAFTMQAKW